MIYVSFSVILVACCNLMLQKLDSISQKYLIFIRFFRWQRLCLVAYLFSRYDLYLVSGRSQNIPGHEKPLWDSKASPGLYWSNTSSMTQIHCSRIVTYPGSSKFKRPNSIDSAHQILEPENDTGLTVLVIFLHKRNTKMPSCMFIPCRRLRTGTSFACPTDNCWFCSLKSYQFLRIFHE